MNKVYLGLGSNIGIKDDNISSALELLQNHESISLTQLSKKYTTLAISNTKQPDYLNCVAEISTILTPCELLTITESIETDMGRTSKGLGDPRIIDIDILFYNQDIISTEDLSIPHHLAHERRFVLEPMNDISPNFIHPILNQSIHALLLNLNE